MESEHLQIHNETVIGIIREAASEAIIATGISWDDYIVSYAANFAESRSTLPNASEASHMVESILAGA